MEITIFEGAQGIKQLFDLALKSKSKQLRTCLTNIPLVILAGDEYANTYPAKREKKQIHLQSLRFFHRIDKHARPNKLKQIRYAPSDVHLPHAVVMWDDFVAFVDEENLMISVHQDIEMSETMQAWFDQLWDISS